MIFSAAGCWCKTKLAPKQQQQEKTCSHRENRHLVINSFSAFREIPEIPKEYIDLAKANLGRYRQEIFGKAIAQHIWGCFTYIQCCFILPYKGKLFHRCYLLISTSYNRGLNTIFWVIWTTGFHMLGSTDSTFRAATVIYIYYKLYTQDYIIKV